MNPLVPSHVDLREFEYVPLSAVRLRDSQLAIEATGDEFRAAVLLWCVAWHQVPAASLPNDDQALAAYAGYGRVIKEWKKVRAGALRGFVLCDDGRLYHVVLAEKAIAAWTEKLKQRYRTECARIKKAAQRANEQPDYPSFEVWCYENDVPSDIRNLSLGTDEGQERDVPAMSRSKGREGKGREGKNSSIGGQGESPPAAAFAQVGTFECHESPTSTPNPVAAFARALTSAGFQVTSLNPELVAYVDEGGSVEHLLEVAQFDKCRGKNGTYVAKAARGELAERASAITPGGSRGVHRKQSAFDTTRAACEQILSDAQDR